MPKSRIVKPDGRIVDHRGENPYGEVKIPNIEMVGPRLLVMPRPVRDYETDSGILVPKEAQGRAQEGIVLLTGDGVLQPNGEVIPPRVKAGDVVIYARYAGVELEIGEQSDKQEFLIIREGDVTCILSYKSPAFVIDD